MIFSKRDIVQNRFSKRACCAYHKGRWHYILDPDYNVVVIVKWNMSILIQPLLKPVTLNWVPD